MGDAAQSSSGTNIPTGAAAEVRGTPKPKPTPPPKREVKILMLHGYTQSGPLFRAKTRALEKLLVKLLSPANIFPRLVYATAPNRLSAKDIPGFTPRSGEEEKEELEAWAWFRKDEATGRYRFVKEGMERVAEVISNPNGEFAVTGDGDPVPEGPFDGVVGFSQGGCAAGMVASVLEHISPDGKFRRAPEEHAEWAKKVREANGGTALKFAVIYSGFWAVPEDLGWLYEPKIRTPTMHFLGSLDTVVEHSRSEGLIERCEEPVVLTHPGGHYVPISKEWAVPLAGFIRKCVDGEGNGKASL
ncbi:uncharacterized protein CTHT_0010690 [Thermochaetoides thermophila DSM 1495]|uniref:Serine hydrolase domain-containing protein n=1 Tax=Chaetomium thermophilum (strain DSM 1495 / CBS 144.50 / IMI 039719) TaxID=759272 RepID=G0S0N8_CHATD|nr:hypothetical protein CTHT_0010690 [Thermochaetoides thermophila DSM 1495]EGS22598.1 hypothetical protein CTHT_0010690 [Thermochaetoides thermophila DSM 1495]